jgi:hypothetical protein
MHSATRRLPVPWSCCARAASRTGSLLDFDLQKMRPYPCFKKGIKRPRRCLIFARPHRVRCDFFGALQFSIGLLKNTAGVLTDLVAVCRPSAASDLLSEIGVQLLRQQTPQRCAYPRTFAARRRFRPPPSFMLKVLIGLTRHRLTC